MYSYSIGTSIQHLTSVDVTSHRNSKQFAEKSAMVRAARQLLSAVTKVLLLADKVIVKQLLISKDKVYPRVLLHCDQRHIYIYMYWIIINLPNYECLICDDCCHNRELILYLTGVQYSEWAVLCNNIYRFCKLLLSVWKWDGRISSFDRRQTKCKQIKSQ